MDTRNVVYANVSALSPEDHPAGTAGRRESPDFPADCGLPKTQGQKIGETTEKR
jgi:hypothetical protein